MKWLKRFRKNNAINQKNDTGIRLLEREKWILRFGGTVSKAPISYHSVICLSLSIPDQHGRLLPLRAIGLTHSIRILYSLRVRHTSTVLLHLGEYNFSKEGIDSEWLAEQITLELVKYMNDKPDVRMMLLSECSDEWQDLIERLYRFMPFPTMKHLD